MDLVEPRLQGHEPLGPQAVQPPTGVVSEHVHVDEPALTQDAEVAAECRPGHVDFVGQVSGTTGRAPQQIHDPATSRVGEGGEGRVEIVSDSVNY